VFSHITPELVSRACLFAFLMHIFPGFFLLVCLQNQLFTSPLLHPRSPSLKIYTTAVSSTLHCVCACMHVHMYCQTYCTVCDVKPPTWQHAEQTHAHIIIHSAHTNLSLSKVCFCGPFWRIST